MSNVEEIMVFACVGLSMTIVAGCFAISFCFGEWISDIFYLFATVSVIQFFSFSFILYRAKTQYNNSKREETG